MDLAQFVQHFLRQVQRRLVTKQGSCPLIVLGFVRESMVLLVVSMKPDLKKHFRNVSSQDEPVGSHPSEDQGEIVQPVQ
jgi:hypothetical protein